MDKNYVTEIRKRRGLSQLKLSYMTGIAPSVICNIENYRIVAYPKWRKKLAEALEVEEKELFPN